VGPPPGGAPPAPATWNIRAAIGPGEPFPPAWWRHVNRDRLASIAAFIGELDADIVSLQEVAVLTVDGDLVDMPRELAAASRTDVRYAAVGHFPIVDPDSGDTIGSCLWGNAILSRRPIVASRALGLPIAGDDELVEPADGRDPLTGGPTSLAGVRYRDAPTGTREPRAAVRATIDAPFGGVDVVATHLTHVGSGQRRAQAAAVASMAVDERPTIVAGDLNAEIAAPALEPLRSRFDDAFAVVDVPPGDPRRISCNGHAIDHVLVRGLRVTECHVVPEAGDRSDHWPIVAVVNGANAV
jgi:endonuclease/exonuclease/phosphatase family metal-dependent hydrolase